MDKPVVCITQARMGSTRLPGKVAMPILGRPLLWWHLTRLMRARLVDRIVVATPEGAEAAPILAIAAALGIPTFQGSEHDVLARYAGAAAMAGAGTIVRVTSDCPLIDPSLIDAGIRHYAEAAPPLDYLRLDTEVYPRGLDWEILPRRLLELAAAEARAAFEREHVTPFVWKRPERFRLGLYGGDGTARGIWRLCVDEPDDFALVTEIFGVLAGAGADPAEAANFGWNEIEALLVARPELARLNAHVAQKKV